MNGKTESPGQDSIGIIKTIFPLCLLLHKWGKKKYKDIKRNSAIKLQ
jgi:hypothetical protein